MIVFDKVKYSLSPVLLENSSGQEIPHSFVFLEMLTAKNQTIQYELDKTQG